MRILTLVIAGAAATMLSLGAMAQSGDAGGRGPRGDGAASRPAGPPPGFHLIPPFAAEKMNLTDDQPDDAEFDGVGTDTTMAPVPLPQEFMDAIKAVSAEASEVSATLHSMYWACNRFLGNRVHCMFVADVAKHLTWLTTYLDRLGPQLLAESGAANSSGGLARSACDFIRTESRYIGAALAQRAHGDYYDLFSDAPNVLHEYPAGIQRLFLAWSHLASTTIRATVGQDAGAFAIVDQGQAPVALSMWKQSVLIFPTGLVYGATNMAWPFCHEVGEAVFAAYFAPGFEETLAPAGQGAPRPGADGSGYWRLREHLRTSGIELSDAKGDLWLFKTCALMREVFCDFFAVQGPLLCDHRPALRHLARRVLAMDPTDADIVSPAFRALVLGMSVIESLPDPIADVRGLDREQRRDKVRAQCVKCARELTATDPLPRILKPGSNEAFDEEVLNMVAAARVLLKSLVDEADQGKLEQNLDAAVGLVGELGLLDETIVAAAKMMAELSRCQAFRLLAAGGSASGNENLLDALGTLNVWAQGALANSDVSVEVCSELLHLSDQAGAGPA